MCPTKILRVRFCACVFLLKGSVAHRLVRRLLELLRAIGFYSSPSPNKCFLVRHHVPAFGPITCQQVFMFAVCGIPRLCVHDVLSRTAADGHCRPRCNRGLGGGVSKTTVIEVIETSQRIVLPTDHARQTASDWLGTITIKKHQLVMTSVLGQSRVFQRHYAGEDVERVG